MAFKIDVIALARDDALGMRWMNYHNVVMMAATVLGVLAYNWNRDSAEAFFSGSKVAFFWFFMCAPVASIVAMIHARRQKSKRSRLLLQAGVLVLTLLLHPLLQIWIAPFHWIYAYQLEETATNVEIVGKPESAAIEALGKPSFRKVLPYSTGATQLRYRHWWPMWLEGAELLVDVERGVVTRVVIRR